MPPLARSAAVALSFVLLSAPPVFERWLGGDTRAYVVATIVLALVDGALVFSWMREPAETGVGASPPNRPDSRRAVVGVVAVAAVALTLVALRRWLHQIFTFPIDPYQGDMLVVVQEGLKRMSHGLNPYTTYHVPWAAVLPYGPMLWGPYAIPMLARADLRFLTVAGELFVPAACAVAATLSAWRGRTAAAAGCLLMLAAITANGPLARFTIIAHTPVYWPLLALLAWFVVRERWYAAAVSLGLLVVARSTMVAMVPVLLMAIWTRDRRRFAGALGLVALAAGLPFLPFAIWDARALAFALYGSYETIVKAAVWPDPTVPHTIGVTGVLLTHHLQRWVETLQIAVMAAVYAACWLALGRRRAPVALMAFALLAFSMTTLWPVTYLYFDVFLLMAAGVLAGMSWLAAGATTSALVGRWSATLAATAALVVAAAWTMLPPGAVDATAVTWRGDPRVASVALLRRAPTAALVDILAVPAPDATPPVAMTATLNGEPLGSAGLGAAGDRITLTAPAHDWHIGANTLQLAVAGPVTIEQVTVRPIR